MKKKILHKINVGCQLIKYQIDKFLRYNVKPKYNLVTDNDNPRVIISLTSFPKRIKEVHLCIKTLMNQTYKPDMIVLWLAKEQFQNGINDLPPKLVKLCKYGLKIEWCEDMKSYKKLIPALVKYPEAIIITTDDDVYYPKDWLEGLMNAHEKNPNCVCCYRAAIISAEKGNINRKHPQKNVKYKEPSILHQQTGCGGVLYPPHSLNQDAINKELFMNLAPTNDDLWFWLMGVCNDTEVFVIGDNEPSLIYVGESQNFSLTAINDNGEQLYDVQLMNILRHYPKLIEKLKFEYQKKGDI
ncbi:MAG: glycosyltransferase [Lachnospiraceae bacterium]|nr:glycosyltransferase [Lachnospiraceae bacterium]